MGLRKNNRGMSAGSLRRGDKVLIDGRILAVRSKRVIDRHTVVIHFHTGESMTVPEWYRVKMDPCS